LGDHYVPQYYLRGFSQDSGGHIWAYDKIEGRAFATQVKSIANENDYYSRELENYLASRVEDPANDVIRKIRERSELTEKDKRVFSEYMVVMMKRVPKGKDRAAEITPSIAGRFSQEIDEALSIIATEQPERNEFIEMRRAEIQEILARYSEEPPKKIWLDNIPPERTPRILEAIAGMTWRFLTFDKHPAFFSSDNPIFFFTDIGIGKPESEVTFPISSSVVLWASWRPNLREGYFPTNKQVVKEINRRTASNATRFVFHCKKEHWILPFVIKGRRQLHRLQ